MSALRPGLRWWPAAAVAAACALVPSANPDLFWHLAAGRKILDEGRVPTRDWLSYTHPNAPWTDFEWLPQALYAALDRGGGLAALFALKVAMVLAIVAVQADHLRRVARSTAVAVAGAAVAAAALLPASDVRPDLFSLLGFALVWHAVERARRDGEDRYVWQWAPLFALWANLHAGFAYGLALLAMGATQTALPTRWGGRGGLSPRACLAPLAAFAGTLAHPHPIAQYALLREVSRDLAMISQHIREWQPASLSDPARLPFWCVMAASLGAAVQHAQRRRSLPALPVLTAAALAVNGARHMRLGAYFVLAAVPLGVWLAEGARDEDVATTSRVPWAVTLAAALLTLAGAASMDLGRVVFRWDEYPVRAAGFLSSQARALGGDGLYHPWHWGGYLGLRLYPRYRVYQDGRYIFHAMLPDEARAGRDPARWQALLDRHRVRVAVMPALDTTFNLPWRARDGSAHVLALPYDMVFMHPSRWALVHWDPVALVFVRRDAFDPAWVDAHEYRAVRPGMPEALAREVATPARRALELERHARDR